MPITQTALDSPIITDSQSSFIGGQFSNAVPLQLDENSCALLEDAEESVTGQAASRRGTAKPGSNSVGANGVISVLDYYKTAAYDYAIAGTTTAGIYKLTGGAWGVLSAGTPPTGVISTTVGNSYLYAVKAAGGSIYRWSGTTWTTLSTDTPPTDCAILLWDGFRLIASGQTTAPDAMYFSGLLNDALWASLTGGYQLQIGSDGRAITAVKAWTGNNIAVFKQNSVWVVGADPQLAVSDMPIQRVHRRTGCIATNSAVQCGNDILFLSNDYTVRSFQQVLASDDQWEMGQPLSFPVQDVLNRINPNAASKASAVFWKDRYLLSIALDSSTTNNYILVFNTITRKWSGGWTGLPISCFTVRNDSGIDKLTMGLHTDNVVIELLDYVLEADTTDDTYTDYTGVTVPFRFITRAMVFGDLDSPKKGFSANLKLYKSRGLMTLTAIFDEGRYGITKTIDTGTGHTALLFPITFPGVFPRTGIQPASFSLMQYPRFRQIQFEVKSAGPGRKEVRALTAQAFMDAFDMRGRFIAQSPS